MSHYMDNPAFREALQQARENAARYARERNLGPDNPPDPPSETVGGRARTTNATNLHGTTARGGGGATATAGSITSPRNSRLETSLASVSDRNSAAAADASGPPMHQHPLAHLHAARMGMRPSPGTSGSLYEQLLETDMHNRLVMEQMARARVGVGLGHRPQPPPHPPTGWRPGPTAPHHFSQHSLELEIAKENEWRRARGLPPLNLMDLATRGATGRLPPQPPAAAEAAAAAPSSSAAPTTATTHLAATTNTNNGNGNSNGGEKVAGQEQSALDGRKKEATSEAKAPVAESTISSTTAAVGSPPAASQNAVEPTNSPAPKPDTGNALFDLLATAAEDTLRREEMKKKSKKESARPDNSELTTSNKQLPASPNTGNINSTSTLTNSKSPFQETSATATGKGKMRGGEKDKKQAVKRKRKGSNEPKNPLGAFVFYQRKIMADVFEDNPLITFGEAAVECGKRWRELPEDQKQEYKDLAAADKERYTRELASFKDSRKVTAEKPVISTPKQQPRPRGRPRKADVVSSVDGKREPRKPRSALMFFKCEEVKNVMREFPHVSNSEANAECSARFRALKKDERAKWEKMANDDKLRYQKELAEFKKSDLVEDNEIPSDKTESGVEEAVQPDDDTAGSDGEEMEKEINHWSPEAVQVPSQRTYDAMVDRNPYYVEEEAWRYHNPPLPPSRETDPEEQTDNKLFTSVSHEDLRPLPPPPPLPDRFPNSGHCRWSYDPETRVLHADFRKGKNHKDGPHVTLEDEQFLLKMYERDDITVISEGLVSGLDKDKWTLDMIERIAGDEYYHKFRRFDKTTAEEEAEKLKPKPKKGRKKSVAADVEVPAPAPEVISEGEGLNCVNHGEVDKCLSMKVKDYVAYLRCRGAALASSSEQDCSEGLHDFTFTDHDGEEHTVDVTKSVLYMIDLDMVKLLPTLHADFVASFKLNGILPGGAHCMMNCVNMNGRPFMGPNMYITPPGSFTHFHQDGHGTVDSGHVCLSGYNEVVMLRRLPERHKRHALRFLTGSYKNLREHTFEALYNLPHGDGLGDKPQWPDNDALEKCNEMNYCVSRFILKEGQCVHINKGRLHAFRKLSPDPLPPNDCHAKLRAELVKPGTTEKVVGPGKPEILCISVAWDWMYRGVTSGGINREIVSSLECAALNRKYGVPSLAIPELSLLQMARTLSPKPTEPTIQKGAYSEGLFGFDDFPGQSRAGSKGFVPTPSVICKGIFPALQYVVKQHIYAMNVAESLKSKSFERCKRVSVAARPNAWENPLAFALDPYGNSDFFCKLCKKELSNCYLHCDGCEILLSKDFNICLECHQEKRYVTSVQMHPLNNKRHSTINHIGNYTYDRASRCPCKNGPVCRHCNYCAGCSCRCHSWFTLQFRFFKKAEELHLLHRVKRMVGRIQLDAAEEAEKRLSMAVKGYYDERERTSFGLHGMDLMVDSEFADVEEIEEEEERMEQDGENTSTNEPEPPAAKRKSRRFSATDETSEVPGNQSEESVKELANDVMEVDVDDMKVKIRFSPGGLARTLSPPGKSKSNGALDDEVLQQSSRKRRTEDPSVLEPTLKRPRRTSKSFEVVESEATATPPPKVTSSNTGSGGGSGGQRKNTGKWSEEERLRLKEALANEPDWNSVELFVGTRRVPQIRTFAERSLTAELQEFKERIISTKENPEVVKANGEVVKMTMSNSSEKGGAEDAGPMFSGRSSSPGSVSIESAKESVSDEENEEKNGGKADGMIVNAGPDENGTTKATKDTIINGSSDSKKEDTAVRKDQIFPSSHFKKTKLKATQSKLKLLHRVRKKEKRTTQDLSGGRLRNNNGSISSNQAADEATASGLPSPEPDGTITAKQQKE